MPFLLAAVACDNEAATPQPEPVIEQTAEITPIRFEVVSSDPVEHGERLSAVLGCIGCHALDLTGQDWSDPDYGVLWTANLTRSAADHSAIDLTAMIVEGKRADRALMDMPSYLFTQLHPDDIAAIVAYLKSLPVEGLKHPEPTIGPALAQEIASGDFKDSVQQVAELKSLGPPDLGEEHAFARSIVRATCAECHGIDLEGDTTLFLDGPPRPPLRIVAAFSKADFFELMKKGTGLGGRELQIMGGISRGRYSRMTDGEVEAVYNYLVELAKHVP